MSKGRVEAFSDGVFAVAATLLIFNITIDKAGPGGLGAALLAAWPKYAAYVASFLTIGVMWINHHSLYERIARINRPLVFLNLLLLMAIVFLPFPTAVLGNNIQVAGDANTAASLYGLNASVIAVFFSGVWTYALSHPDLLAPGVDREEAMRSWPRFSVGLVAYLACIPLGQLSPIAVVIVCAALGVYYLFDRLPDMLENSPADVAILGRWPEVAPQAGRASVVVCGHVLYNVADLMPFLSALNDAAERRVVVEITRSHPRNRALERELWRHFWNLERPQGPTLEDA